MVEELAKQSAGSAELLAWVAYPSTPNTGAKRSSEKCVNI
jgi:hypothetical protein